MQKRHSRQPRRVHKYTAEPLACTAAAKIANGEELG
jgi:hypothetical protein